MELILLAISVHRVTSIAAALITNYIICVLGEQIYDLGFAFVSPLRSYYYYVSHKELILAPISNMYSIPEEK